MRLAISPRRTRRLAIAGLLSFASFDGRIAWAQGCVPSRFTSPALGALGGGGGDIYLSAGSWQLGLAYRRLTSDQVIVGHQVRNDLGAGGRPSIVHSQLLNLSLVRGVTDRLSLTLNVPVSRGSQSGVHADGLWHENTSAGLGEISVAANYWLRNAQALQPGGNVAIGFGVKAPSGKNNVQGTVWKADGTSVPFPVVPAIELGDGGWGFTLNTKAFHPLGERSYVYGGGSYTLNPKKTTDVMRSPGSTVPWAAPDTWDASAGVSTLASSSLGLSLNLGALAYGTPRRDVIGGRDNGNRLPATVGYVSPGLGITRGAHTFTFSVPRRVYMNFLPSYADAAAGRSGGGGLARHMILTSYTARF
jgi:hypothetical protein